MVCPVCKRAFPAARRVCPVDGAQLVDDTDDAQWAGATLAGDPSVDAATMASVSDGRTVTAGGAGEPAREPSRPQVRSTAAHRGTSQPQVPAPVHAQTGPPSPDPHPRTQPSVSLAQPRQTRAQQSPATSVQQEGPSTAGQAASAGGPGTQPPLVSVQSYAPPPEIALAPGTMVGEYQITGLLGTGGMGSVYAGVQPMIGKKVAIKVLLREFAANPEVVGRFWREARAVNEARSKYIVDIFSFGQLPDTRHYFVMEQLEGQSLRQFLKDRKTLKFEEAYSILQCVTRGLAAAHAKGIVHRDIKPENIVVNAEDDGTFSAKLLDFGIAKLQGGDSSQPGFATRTGAAMGTPYYMSPEQCRGANVDHRTDIYALGIIMFEMFTGALPFTARSYIDLVNKHLFASPPSPSKMRDTISPPLEALILHCIAKNPNERPASMEEVIAELSKIAPGLRGMDFTLTPMGPDTMPPESEPRGAVTEQQAVVPGARAPRRTMLVVGLLIGAVLVLGGATGAYLFLARQRDDGKGAGSAQQLAQLSMSTRPAGAEVFVDDKPQPSRTPLTIKVRPGRHHLRVVLSGHQEVNESLELNPGQDRELTYVMVAVATKKDQPLGKLVVRSGHAEATYELDGKLVGSGETLQLDGVKPGEHTLRVSAPGRVPAVKAVTVEPSGTLTMEVALRAKGAKGGKLHKPDKRDKTGKPDKKGETTGDPDDTLDPFKRRRTQ